MNVLSGRNQRPICSSSFLLTDAFHSLLLGAVEIAGKESRRVERQAFAVPLRHPRHQIGGEADVFRPEEHLRLADDVENDEAPTVPERPVDLSEEMLEVQQVVQRGVSEDNVERILLDLDEIEVERLEFDVEPIARYLLASPPEEVLVDVRRQDFVRSSLQPSRAIDLHAAVAAAEAQQARRGEAPGGRDDLGDEIRLPGRCQKLIPAQPRSAGGGATLLQVFRHLDSGVVLDLLRDQRLVAEASGPIDGNLGRHPEAFHRPSSSTASAQVRVKTAANRR